MRVLWTARRSNQSILKEISPEYSLECLMLKLKLQQVGHLMQRANSLEKILMLGKIEGKRRRRQQRMRWLEGITNSADMNLCKPQETVKNSGTWLAAIYRVVKSQTQFSDRTTTKSAQMINNSKMHRFGYIHTIRYCIQQHGQLTPTHSVEFICTV